MGGPIDHLLAARSYYQLFAKASAVRSSVATLCYHGLLTGWVSWNNGGNERCIYRTGLIRKRFPPFIVRSSSVEIFRNTFHTCQANMVKESNLNGAVKVNAAEVAAQSVKVEAQEKRVCLFIFLLMGKLHIGIAFGENVFGGALYGCKGGSMICSDVRDPEVVFEFTEEKLCFLPLFEEVFDVNLEVHT